MDNLMSDAEFEQALDDLMYADADVKRSIAQMMNEHQIITWEEAEQILADTGDEPIKCSLPQQVRPTEPDNDTNVDQSIQSLLQNDPKMNTVNLNNLKRTPIPQIKRIITAMKDNEYIEKLSLANMGLYDKDVEPLIEVLEDNESLRVLNLETNYLSGEFFARLFQAALKNQTLEEIKAVNQGVSFSTESERAMIKSIFQNRGLLKISVNFRLPEGRHKVEQTTMRNQEIRRILRRQAAEEARLEEERRIEAERPKPKKPPPVIKTAPSILKTAGAPTKAESTPKPETPKVENPPAEPPRIKSDAEIKSEAGIPKWRRPNEGQKLETSEPPRIKSDAEIKSEAGIPKSKWKRPEEEQKVENPPAETGISKWRRQREEKKLETSEPPRIKAEIEVPKWRRPKQEPETSEIKKPLKSVNSSESEDKPSTSNKLEDSLKKSIVKNSSSSETVDGVEKPKIKKKKPLAIPPVILADPVPPSPNEKIDKLDKFEKPKESVDLTKSQNNNAKPDTSQLEKPKRLIIQAPESTLAGLTIPKDNLLSTSTATSATESDAVSSTSSKPRKKKIIRVRRKKKPVPLPENNSSENKIQEPSSRKFNEVPENKEEKTSSKNFNDHLEVLVDYPESKLETKIEENDEGVIKPKKKVVKKKKSEEEPKLNGNGPKKMEDLIDKPMGVFPRSRLISANKQ